MTPLESMLLQELTGGDPPKLVLRTRTRIDCGRWWRATPVWLCVSGGELILLAVARRRYFERIAVADCQSSFYNHAGGELVIKPGESLRINRFAMSAKEALGVMEFIQTHHERAVTGPEDSKPNPQP